MSDLGAVRDGWREAWRFRGPLIAAHLANRLLLAAIVVPVAAAILRLGIGLSDQAALTDQDIVAFEAADGVVGVGSAEIIVAGGANDISHF